MNPAVAFRPIPLAHGGLIKSVAEARDFMAQLPAEAAAEAHWKYARDLLLRALMVTKAFARLNRFLMR